MVNFPAIASAFQSLRSGFSDAPAIPWNDIKDAAPPLMERKGISFSTTLEGIVDQGYQRLGYDRIYTLLQGGGPGWANETVNIDTATNLSPTWACKRIVCETMASLPFQLLERPKPGELKYRNDLPVFDVMTHGNDERSAFSFIETMTYHLMFMGNAYAKIIRRSSKTNRTALDLQLLIPEQVEVSRDRDSGYIKYKVHPGGGQKPEFYYVVPGQPQDILHIRGAGYDGLIGYSMLKIARQTLGSAIALEKNWARFLANGGRRPYILNSKVPFSNDGKRQEFRAKWQNSYAEPHKVPLLEGDAITYQEIGMTVADAQLFQSRQMSVPEQCRVWGVSPSLVFDLSKANYNSLEQLVRSFINFSMRGHMDRWADDFRRCVLTPEEKKQGIYVNWDTNEIAKGDFQTRMAAYATALQNGIYSIDQVLEKEGEEPVGLNEHMVQMQMIAAADQSKPQSPDEIEKEEDEAD